MPHLCVHCGMLCCLHWKCPVLRWFVRLTSAWVAGMPSPLAQLSPPSAHSQRRVARLLDEAELVWHCAVCVRGAGGAGWGGGHVCGPACGAACAMRAHATALRCVRARTSHQASCPHACPPAASSSKPMHTRRPSVKTRPAHSRLGRLHHSGRPRPQASGFLSPKAAIAGGRGAPHAPATEPRNGSAGCASTLLGSAQRGKSCEWIAAM